jgi:hypothetical protein
MIFIFSYNRRKMLQKAIAPFMPEPVHIIDDGSDFTLKNDNFHRLPHAGKQHFYRNWNYALEMAKASNDDLFIFSADDLFHTDVDRITRLHEQHKHKAYAYNLQNDGRMACWTKIMPRVDGDALRVGFVDCLFFCNRAALEAIGWTVGTVPEEWFNRHSSSGVGHNLSHAFVKNRVTMYLPLRSIGYHGDHESMMHPEERKRNPLISR